MLGRTPFRRCEFQPVDKQDWRQFAASDGLPPHPPCVERHKSSPVAQLPADMRFTSADLTGNDAPVISLRATEPPRSEATCRCGELLHVGMGNLKVEPLTFPFGWQRLRRGPWPRLQPVAERELVQPFRSQNLTRRYSGFCRWCFHDVFPPS